MHYRFNYLYVFIPFMAVISGWVIANDAEHNNKSTWYQSPMLAVMTGFVYQPLSPYGFDEWRKGLASEFDADEFVGSLKQAGVDYLIYYDKWSDGYVWHDTKTTNFKSSRDFIKEISPACHKHGIRLVIYFNPVFDGNPEFSPWAIKDRFGHTIPFLLEWPLSFGNLHDPGFRQATLEQLTELFTNYGRIDGVWLDIFTDGYGIKYAARNPSAIQAYEERYEKPFDQASLDEIKTLYKETRARYFADARAVCKKYQNDTIFTFNGSINTITYDGINNQLDYWMTETCTLDKTDFQAHRSHFCPRPTEMGSLINKTWFVPLEDEPPALGRDSQKLVMAESALALCRGASIYLALTPGHSGRFGPDLQAVHKVGKWYKKIQPYIQHTQPYAEIAVILGTPSEGAELPLDNTFWRNFNKQQSDAIVEAISVCEDLETAGYFSKILYAHADYSNWPRSLSEFKAIVLPERVMLDAKHVERIRDYVNNGGQLIAFGHATYLNENGTWLADFALGDVYGVQEVKWKGQGGKIFFNEPFKEKYFDNQSFDTLANNITIDTAPQTEVIAAINSGSLIPAVVCHTFGQGKSYYVTTGQAAFRGKRTFWKGLTRMIAGEPACIVCNEETYDRKGQLYYIRDYSFEKKLNRYCALMNDTPGGKVLHLIDRKGGSDKITVKLSREAVGEIGRATLIESHQDIPLFKKDNRFEFTVPCNPVASIAFRKK